MSDWYDKDLDDIFKPKPFTRLRKFFRGIGRLIAYTPVIYRNEEWDPEYMDELVAFKLNRMIKYHKKYNQFEAKDKLLEQMNLAYHYLKFPDPKGEGYRRAGYNVIETCSDRWWW